MFGLVDRGAQPGPEILTEIRFVAYLLTAIFLFDSFVWTLFWNVVLNGSEWEFSPGTLAAAVFAMAMAAVFSIFERSLLISPTGARTGRLAIAYGARVLMVLVAAVMTAQPLELIVFGDAIDKRLVAEWRVNRAIEEAQQFAAVVKMTEARVVPQVRVELAEQAWWQACLVAETRGDNAQAAQTQLLQERTAVEGRIAAAEKAVLAAGKQPDKDLQIAAIKKYTTESASLAAELKRVDARLDDARRTVESSAGLRPDCDKRFEESLRAKAVEANLEERKKTIDAIASLRSDGPSQRPAEWSNFLERLAVVDALRTGRPLVIDEARSEPARELLGLDLNSFSPIRADPGFYSAIYLVFYGLGCLVPLVGLAYKLAMPDTLTAFFRDRSQRPPQELT